MALNPDGSKYDPSTETRRKGELTREQLRAFLDWQKMRAPKAIARTKLPTFVRKPIPADYPRFAVDHIVDADREIHEAKILVDFLAEDIPQTAEDRQALASARTRLANAYVHADAVWSHYTEQAGTGAALTPYRKPRRKRRTKAEIAADAAEAEARAKKIKSGRVKSPKGADTYLAKLKAERDRLHDAWRDAADKHGQPSLDPAQTERYFAELQAEVDAALTARDALPGLIQTDRATPEKKAAHKAYKAVEQKLIRHRAAHKEQTEAGHLGFVPPAPASAVSTHPEVQAAREAYDAAHSLWTRQVKQFAEQAANGDPLTVIQPKRKSRGRKKKQPKPSTGRRRYAPGEKPPPPPMITDAGRDKGNVITKLRGWQELDWRPYLLYPADAADVLVAQRLLRKQNPVPETDPSWDEGDTFHVLHRTARVDQQNALIAALNNDGDLDAYLAAVTTKATTAWKAAGGRDLEPFRHNFRPDAVGTLPPCLMQHVAPLPGTVKLVVAGRHLQRVLDALSAAKFPYPVIEFAGLPIFATYLTGTPGWKGKPGKLPQAQKLNTVPIQARVIKPGEPGPLTGAGNITPAIQMTPEALDEAIGRNIAFVRYYPLEEARALRDERIAPFVADLSTDLIIAQSELDAEKASGATSQALAVKPKKLERPKKPTDVYGPNWRELLGIPLEPEFNSEKTEGTA